MAKIEYKTSKQMTHATAKKIKEQNEEHHDEQLPTNTNLKKDHHQKLLNSLK